LTLTVFKERSWGVKPGLGLYVFEKNMFCFILQLEFNMVETRNVCLASNLPTLTDCAIELGV